MSIEDPHQMPRRLLIPATGESISYPYMAVKRGQRNLRIGPGEATLQEHVMGIREMMHATSNPELAVQLDRHMGEVLTESSVSRWEDTRAWSELCFRMINESVWAGWNAREEINQARVAMATLPSQVARAHVSAAATPSAATRPHRSHPTPQTTGRGKERVKQILGEGQVCWAYNRTVCEQLDGHMYNDKQRFHICSFCVNYLGKREHHKEKDCDEKARHKGSASGFGGLGA